MADIRVHVRYGPSRLLRGERPIPTWMAGELDTLCVLGLDATSLEFLIDHLPREDGFTKGLRELRDRAKDELWARETL